MSEKVEGVGEMIRPDDTRATISTQAYSIFVSYRVDPDERIAIALKKLLEGALDPAPRVFVSGAGGLVPSNVSFGAQLAAAARQAVVFVGIFTSRSKEREWINFEAGAAWGRDAFYAPLAIDLDMKDLPSTVNGYQAVRARDSEAIKGLLAQIANRTGTELKPYFGNRYTAFERIVAAYPNDPAPTENSITALPELFLSERYAEAERMVDDLFQKSASDREKAEIRVAAIVWDLRNREAAQAAKLDSIAPALRAVSPDYHYWRASCEHRAHVKRAHYEQCLALDPAPHARRESLSYLAAAAYQRGDIGGTLARLSVLLNSSDPLDRTHGSWQYSRLDPNIPNELKFSLLSIALNGSPDERHFRAACDLAWDETWVSLLCFLSKRFDDKVENGAAANSLGMAATLASCPNLSVQAYEKAAAKGTSVAKVNIATLHMNGPVITGPLAVLRAHEGPFDAASPGYPYSTRALLEETLHAEGEIFDKRLDEGRRIFDAWSEFAESAAATLLAQLPAKNASISRMTLGGVLYELSWADTSFTAKGPDGKSLVFQGHRVFPGLFYLRSDADLTVVFLGAGSPQALLLSLGESVQAVFPSIEVVVELAVVPAEEAPSPEGPVSPGPDGQR